MCFAIWCSCDGDTCPSPPATADLKYLQAWSDIIYIYIYITLCSVKLYKNQMEVDCVEYGDSSILMPGSRMIGSFKLAFQSQTLLSAQLNPSKICSGIWTHNATNYYFQFYGALLGNSLCISATKASHSQDCIDWQSKLADQCLDTPRMLTKVKSEYFS